MAERVNSGTVAKLHTAPMEGTEWLRLCCVRLSGHNRAQDSLLPARRRRPAAGSNSQAISPSAYADGVTQ